MRDERFEQARGRSSDNVESQVRLVEPERTVVRVLLEIVYRTKDEITPAICSFARWLLLRGEDARDILCAVQHPHDLYAIL